MMRGLLLAVAVVGLGLAWWQLQSPVVEPRTTAPPAVADQRARANIAGYKNTVAMELAGRLVPPELEEYYFMEVKSTRSDSELTAELADLLRRASDDRDFLGVIGGNTEQTKAIFLAALDAAADAPLLGATIVYIGIASDESTLRDAAERHGAEFRFGAYTAVVGPALDPMAL